jgi:hypothetical protein
VFVMNNHWSGRFDHVSPINNPNTSRYKKDPKRTDSKHTVRFEADWTPIRVMEISWHIESQGRKFDKFQSPWSYTEIVNTGDYVSLDVAATDTGGDVSCRIYVNGDLKDFMNRKRDAGDCSVEYIVLKED